MILFYFRYVLKGGVIIYLFIFLLTLNSKMSDISDNIRSSPTSTNSGNLSSDLLPPSLVNEELQLALNKVLLSIH